MYLKETGLWNWFFMRVEAQRRIKYNEKITSAGLVRRFDWHLYSSGGSIITQYPIKIIDGEIVRDKRLSVHPLRLKRRTQQNVISIEMIKKMSENDWMTPHKGRMYKANSIGFSTESCGTSSSYTGTCKTCSLHHLSETTCLSSSPFRPTFFWLAASHKQRVQVDYAEPILFQVTIWNGVLRVDQSLAVWKLTSLFEP